jgi:phage terminase large subunit-like protein
MATSSPRSARSAHKPLRPFTTDHFRRYAGLMVLDTGDYWEPEPFQLEIVADVFSGLDEFWVVIPEGNAKTTLMSGVALYHGDYTPTAEVLMAAASRDQAGILFNQAAGFVDRSPGFRDRFQVFEGYRRIRCLRTGGRLQVFAADDRTGDGVIPTLGLVDEPHRARNLALVRTWRGKLQKRGGQLGLLSTAGEPGTEFEDARARILADALEITRDGFHTRARGENAVLNDWSVPRDADVHDLEVVKQANPLSTITVDTLRKKHSSPTMTETHWRRFVCNQAVRGEETAVNPQEWGALGWDGEIPAGETIDVGLDLGWKHDTTAIVPLWIPDAEQRVFGVPVVLVPPRDGQFLEPAEIKAAFREMHERNPVRYVVMDEDRGAEIAAWLRDELGVTVVGHLQSHAPMVLAYDRFMEAVRNGWIRHPRDSEFTEHVLNAVAKVLPDGRARFDRPSTSRAATGQRRRVIDALVAAAMVHSVASAEMGFSGDFFFAFSDDELEPDEEPVL